jgi:hypothetical protein
LHRQKKSQVLIIIDWELPPEQAVFLLSKAVDYMAARKPMLAITTRGSTIHKLIDGVYGRCFEHHDTSGIARYLKWLIDNFKQRDGQVYETYPVDRDYSASGNAQRLYDLIQNLSNSKSTESL